MKVAHVRISNVLGIDELEFSPAGFTEIAGRNGTGKTSVLEAIKSVAKGGHDATLLRNGAEKGEVVFVLDDGTQIKRRIGAATSTTDVLRDGKKVPRPADVIRSLTDALSVNPVEFLNAGKRDRVRVLLESMPIELDADRLAKLAGVPVTAAPDVHPLQVLEHVRKQVYDARTGANRAVKEKEATIKQLRQAIPPPAAGIEGDEEELMTQLDTLADAKDAELERIEFRLAELGNVWETRLEELRAEIEQIQAERNDFTGRASRQRALTLERFNETRQPVLEALGAIRADRESAVRRLQTLDTIQILSTELEDLADEAADHSRALDEIDSYKSELLAALPIEGLEVIDGEIYRDGVTLDRLNTAQQVDIAVELAKLRAGKLGVICVDGIESLDPAAFESFRDRALESGLQLFVTKVTADDFSVSSHG
jgi:ABC-type cobalamin/Fe3+-siderophores transport system ATPase subunit